MQLAVRCGKCVRGCAGMHMLSVTAAQYPVLSMSCCCTATQVTPTSAMWLSQCVLGGEALQSAWWLRVSLAGLLEQGMVGLSQSRGLCHGSHGTHREACCSCR